MVSIFLRMIPERSSEDSLLLHEARLSIMVANKGIANNVVFFMRQEWFGLNHKYLRYRSINISIKLKIEIIIVIISDDYIKEIQIFRVGNGLKLRRSESYN